MKIVLSVMLLFALPHTGRCEVEMKATYFALRDSILGEIHRYFGFLKPVRTMEEFLTEFVREEDPALSSGSFSLNHNFVLVYRGLGLIKILFRGSGRRLEVEFYNSQVQAKLSVGPGAGIRSAASMAARHTRDFLRLVEQVVFSLEQIESDILALVYYEFQGVAPVLGRRPDIWHPRLSDAKLGGVAVQVDQDENFVALESALGAHNSDARLDRQIFFYVQSVRGDVEGVGEYFKHRTSNFAAKASRGRRIDETANFLFTVSEARLGSFELSLVRLESSVAMRLTSPFFDYTYEYSTLTRRFLLRAVEKALTKLRDFYFGLQQSEFFEPRNQESGARLVEHAKLAFRYTWNTLLKTDEPRTLAEFERLQVDFSAEPRGSELVLTLTMRPKEGKKDAPEALDVLVEDALGSRIVRRAMVFEKRVPIGSRFNGYAFPMSWFRSLFGVCERIFPVVSSHNPVVLQGENMSFYKLVANPFVDFYFDPVQHLAGDHLLLAEAERDPNDAHVLELVLFKAAEDPQIARIVPGTGFVDFVWAPAGHAPHPFESIPLPEGKESAQKPQTPQKKEEKDKQLI